MSVEDVLKEAILILKSMNIYINHYNSIVHAYFKRHSRLSKGVGCKNLLLVEDI